jgi:hypothetical protein
VSSTAPSKAIPRSVPKRRHVNRRPQRPHKKSVVSRAAVAPKSTDRVEVQARSARVASIAIASSAKPGAAAYGALWLLACIVLGALMILPDRRHCRIPATPRLSSWRARRMRDGS